MGRCVAGQTKTFGIELGSVANAGKFQVNPTLDAADFRLSINGGSFAALTNTPTVSPAGGAQVVVVLAAAETTAAGAGGRIHFRASDSSGGEWHDLAIDFDVYATAEDTLVTTVTNLTNAPTNGDLTATMKTSVTTAATVATPTVTAGTVSDKSGYSLSTTPPTAAQIRTEMDSNSTQLAKLGTPAGASLAADVAAVKSETASIQSDTNDLQTQVGTAGAGLTALASATNLATLAGYVDTEVGAIKANTDNLPADPADASDIAASLATITGYIDTEIATILAAVDTEVAAIKTVTDNLPNSGALTTITNNIAAILADTGTDGVVLADGAITAAKIAANAIAAAKIATDALQAIADAVLARSRANTDNTASTDSLYELIGAILDGSTATGGLVVKKTDGVTTFNTRPLDTDPDAVPIVGIGG